MAQSQPLTLREYQNAAGNTDLITEDQFRSNHYYILGLNGESGEFLEKVILLHNSHKHSGHVSEEARHAAALELSDICWYVIREVKQLEGSDTDSRSVDEIQRIQPYDIEFDAEDLLQIAVQISIVTGEMSDITKKMVRDNANHFTQNIANELTERCYRLVELCSIAASCLGYKYSQVLCWNIEKLLSRKLRDQIHGSGDDR